MIRPGIPYNEAERLRKLHELDILESLNEQVYDDLAKLASRICNMPIALICLIDEDRKWFKSNQGLEICESPRDLSFCAHAILDDSLFIVEDATKDERFFDNPIVVNSPFVHFYAGAPLIIDDDIRLGTLCVIDIKPNRLSVEQKVSLKALARQVVSQFELRLKVKLLTALDHAKDEFITMISHELRTPLTSIVGSLSMLATIEKDSIDEQMGTLIDISFRNSLRLNRIVSDIIDVSKLDSGKMHFKRESIDLLEVVNTSIKLNAEYCRQQGCKIILTEKTRNFSTIVTGDEQRILQVLNNLLSNAAKFSYQNTDIEIFLSCTTDEIRVAIKNYGDGISQKNQQYVFEKFRQIGDYASYKQDGTGLGLNICKKIIELHQGSIEYESIPKKYTSFFFCLPVLSDSNNMDQKNAHCP